MTIRLQHGPEDTDISVDRVYIFTPNYCNTDNPDNLLLLCLAGDGAHLRRSSVALRARSPMSLGLHLHLDICDGASV